MTVKARSAHHCFEQNKRDDISPKKNVRRRRGHVIGRNAIVSKPP